MKKDVKIKKTQKKLNRTKSTLWNLFHLYVNVIIGIVRGILIIPLYLRFISSDLYGAWLATGNILMWLTLFDPGIGDVAIQKISEAFGKKDNYSISNLISTSIFLSALISIIMAVIGLLVSDLIIHFVRIPENINQIHLKIAFNIGIISTAITLFFYSLSSAIIGMQELKMLGWFRNGVSILALIINIILLFYGYQLLSIAYAGLISSIIQAIGYGIILHSIMKREKISLVFNYIFLKNYSKIFGFTFFSKLFSTIAQNIDLILISRYVSIEKVTILELSRRPIKVIRGLAITPSQAMMPSVSHLYGEHNINRLREVMNSTLRVFHLIFILIAVCFIAFNEPLISLWVGTQYYIGNYLNIILVLTFLFSTSSYIFSNYTYCIGKIKENSVFEMYKNAISIILLIFGGYFGGLKGVVLAGLLGTLFTEFWYYPYLLNRNIHFHEAQIKSFLKELIFAIVGSGIITIFFNFLNPLTWGLFLLYGGLFFLLVFSFFLFISKDLRIMSNQIIKAPFKK